MYWIDSFLMPSYRAKCSISLPQPQAQDFRPNKAVLQILNTNTVVPDCAVFIPAALLKPLSGSVDSPFNKLSRSKLVGAGTGEKSFRVQCTPKSQLQNTPGFEFASSFWEDKPAQGLADDAYRQNRMSTVAAVRHLHSLHVRAPVFGLVWVDGKVRAHVEWCVTEHDKPVRKISRISSSTTNSGHPVHSFRPVPRS